MTDERVAALDAIGFEWVGNAVNERWNERFRELQEYKEENGHCDVPRSEGPLGTWVMQQRTGYRKREAGKKTALTDERAAALDLIGFKWKIVGRPNEERWNEWLVKLRRYREENGHCNVPRTQGPLGRWVRQQRSLCRKREKREKTPLTDERAAALNELDFQWKLR